MDRGGRMLKYVVGKIIDCQEGNFKGNSKKEIEERFYPLREHGQITFCPCNHEQNHVGRT
jgi:hypothetical protein